MNQVFFDLNQLKKNKVIDFLPGIFYVYKKVGQDFELIHWNNNHETVTGYSTSELKGMKVMQFFYPRDFKVVKDGLTAIMTQGVVKQVYAYLRLKHGETLPYLFEGFRFESDGEIYFLGVGLDVSNYISVRRELSFTQAELQKRNRELMVFGLQDIESLEFKKSLIQTISELQKIDSIDVIKERLKRMERNLSMEGKKQEIWKILQLRFKEIHPEYFQSLKSSHPLLTKSELMYLGYLKINLSRYQILNLLNVGKEAIKKKRYRIRKKMGLGADSTLENYIEQF